MTFKFLEENEYSFYNINTLDMIVSGQELDFIEGIQSEIQQASYTLVGDMLTNQMLVEKGLKDVEASMLIATLVTHKVVAASEDKTAFVIQSPIYDFLGQEGLEIPMIDAKRLAEIRGMFKENVLAVENGNSKKSKRLVKVKPALLNEFKHLWETINRQSKVVYSGLKEEALLEGIAKAFAAEAIDPVPIKVITREYNTQTNTLSAPTEQVVTDKVEYFAKHDYQALVETLLKDTKLKLPLAFILKLLNALDLSKFQNNPQKATARLKTIIAEQVHKSVIQSVDYAFTGETRITTLQDDNGNYLSQFPYTLLGRKFVEGTAPTHLLYDTVVYDSEIERDIQLKDPSAIGEEKITVFAKLPTISIPTPYKTYNPDFAYLVSRPHGKKLFLVVEAKGYNSESDIPADEKHKIAYAEKFFKKLQKEMPDVEIAFKKRVNKTDLSTILQQIAQGA